MGFRVPSKALGGNLVENICLGWYLKWSIFMEGANFEVALRMESLI